MNVEDGLLSFCIHPLIFTFSVYCPVVFGGLQSFVLFWYTGLIPIDASGQLAFKSFTFIKRSCFIV